MPGGRSAAPPSLLDTVHGRERVKDGFFNIFNYVQFAPPVTQADSPLFGRTFNQANKPRLIQGALRLNF